MIVMKPPISRPTLIACSVMRRLRWVLLTLVALWLVAFQLLRD
jgi:hypothetical protein